MENGRVAGITVSKVATDAAAATTLGGDSSAAPQDEVLRCDAVVLATGGFAANKTLLEVWKGGLPIQA